MPNKMNIYYISVEGNTKHFVTKMSKWFKNMNVYRITNQSDFKVFKKPFFCFIPTYAKGTREDPKLHEKQPGLNLGIHELAETLVMNEMLGYKDNYKSCLGLIGSGNRNFGIDLYCWTAMHYHRKYGIPMIDDYELRGTISDENRINKRMTKIWNKAVPSHQVQFSKHGVKDSRLQKLEEQYHQNM